MDVRLLAPRTAGEHTAVERAARLRPREEDGPRSWQGEYPGSSGWAPSSPRAPASEGTLSGCWRAEGEVGEIQSVRTTPPMVLILTMTGPQAKGCGPLPEAETHLRLTAGEGTGTVDGVSIRTG